MTEIDDAIQKEFGTGILTSGQSILDAHIVTIPVSPGLDLILGGGVPAGSLFILTGPPKVGKTATALDFASTAQHIQYACDIGRKEGRHVYYFNVEGRIKRRDLAGICNIDISEERLTIIQSQPGNILTGEAYISIAEKLIHQCPGDIFIMDSFSALCTSSEMAANIGDRYRADAPLLLARFCRRISNVLPINKSILIGITHIIANQGQGMKTWIEASGRKLQYQVDVKLRATHHTPWLANETQIGQEINWVCETTATNTPPGGKFASKLRYGYGLDKPAELIGLCVDLGMIKKGGSWYTFPDDTKFQGLEKASQGLRDNHKLYTELHNEVRELMGIADENDNTGQCISGVEDQG